MPQPLRRFRSERPLPRRCVPAMRAATARPAPMAARSRGPPRSSVRRDSARARSGAAARSSRIAWRRPRVGEHPGDRVEAPCDRRRIGRRPGQDGARASRAPAPVTVRSMAAIRLPCRAPDNVCVSSRLARVAASMSMASPAASRDRRRQRRTVVDLRLLDVGERRGRGREFDARERAEAVERAHAEICRQVVAPAVAAVEEGRRTAASPPRPARARSQPVPRRRRARRRRSPRADRCGRGRRRGAPYRWRQRGTRRWKCRSRRGRRHRRRRRRRAGGRSRRGSCCGRRRAARPR